jgi:hypothetical protein
MSPHMIIVLRSLPALSRVTGLAMPMASRSSWVSGSNSSSSPAWPCRTHRLAAVVHEWCGSSNSSCPAYMAQLPHSSSPCVHMHTYTACELKFGLLFKYTWVTVVCVCICIRHDSNHKEAAGLQTACPALLTCAALDAAGLEEMAQNVVASILISTTT